MTIPATISGMPYAPNVPQRPLPTTPAHSASTLRHPDTLTHRGTRGLVRSIQELEIHDKHNRNKDDESPIWTELG